MLAADCDLLVLRKSMDQLGGIINGNDPRPLIRIGRCGAPPAARAAARRPRSIARGHRGARLHKQATQLLCHYNAHYDERVRYGEPGRCCCVRLRAPDLMRPDRQAAPILSGWEPVPQVWAGSVCVP